MKIGKVNIEHTENGTIITPIETIKIIDLFNKVANGEEVPQKIKYNDRIYNYSEDIDYKREADYGGYIYLMDNLVLNEEMLNKEVEIIEKIKH